MSILCLADRGTALFEQKRTAVDVVCAGDSLTGWNNEGPIQFWPYPTYPQFLAELAPPLRIANCGIAGEISDNGIGQVRDYLDLFPNAHQFIIGYGTNDLGMWPDTEQTSRRIIENLDRMVGTVAERGKKAILFNVPYVNEGMFAPFVAKDAHGKRDYHNARLEAYCHEHGVPLADICSRLRDEHFADELHPNGAGANIIAKEVFRVLGTTL